MMWFPALLGSRSEVSSPREIHAQRLLPTLAALNQDAGQQGDGLRGAVTSSNKNKGGGLAQTLSLHWKRAGPSAVLTPVLTTLLGCADQHLPQRPPTSHPMWFLLLRFLPHLPCHPAPHSAKLHRKACFFLSTVAALVHLVPVRGPTFIYPRATPALCRGTSAHAALTGAGGIHSSSVVTVLCPFVLFSV